MTAGGDELDNVDTGAVELRAQCLGVRVHSGLRGGVAGHGREGQAALDRLADARIKEPGSGELARVNWLPDTLEEARRPG